MSVELERLAHQTEERPAPGPLLAVQAFANTIDVEDGIERLESVESYRDWLRNSGLGARGVSVSEADLRAARELRDTVRALLAANERGTTDRTAAKALAATAERTPAALTVDAEGRLEPDLSPVKRAGDLIPRLLAVIFQAQLEQTWPRLKLCENPDCLWAFYDSSKNRSGSWCQMGVCGNRLKNRAYRERLKRRR